MKNIQDFFNEVISTCLEEPTVLRLSENAMWLLEQRYFIKRFDSQSGEIRKEKTFEELIRRISRVIASAETLYNNDVEWIRTLEKNIAADMLNKRFCFNSPCLFNAGANLVTDPYFSEILYKSPDCMTYSDYKALYDNRQKNQQLFACFVIDIPDSIDGIFGSVRDASIISKYGGGVGASFGHIREKGAAVHDGGNGGVASGPVSFMRTWDTMADVVVQGGKRRAALMGMLPISHPDIEEFIDCKTEDNKLPYFNISVAISNLFMERIKTGHMQHILESPYLPNTDEPKLPDSIDADMLFDKLCKAAWQRGDPGVFFIDKANADSMLKNNPDYQIESTNPCGEQPLPNYTSCNLGSINISEFVKNDGFDWEALNAQIIRSMYYLDLVIDASVYPLEKIEQRTKAIRPVGLGIMGLADALIKQGIIYGTKTSTDFCGYIARTFSAASLAATVLNPKEPFSLAEQAYLDTPSLNSALSALISPKNVFSGEEVRFINSQVQARKFRNSRRLSIAPTGSISMLFDTSPGIEPNFAWHWSRRVTTPDGNTETRDYWHPLLLEYSDLADDEKELHKVIAENGFFGRTFITAHEVTPERHVEMAGVFAPYIDSGISKTVNLPHRATVEDVKKVYLRAYELGLKGITVYRDGSRSTQPIETMPENENSSPKTECNGCITECLGKDCAYNKECHGCKKDNLDTAKAAFEKALINYETKNAKVKSRSAPVIFGKTIKETTPWGSIYITLNFDGATPFETFINVGKSGSELKAMTEALARVISIGLRSGCQLEDFIDTLKGLSGKETWLLNSDDEHTVRSIPDAIALLLSKLLEHNKTCALKIKDSNKDVCPECGAPMEPISGCYYCFSCGYSPCK